MRTKHSLQLREKRGELERIMAAYKLTYLNYKARGELVRFILAYAEVDYEDVRLVPEKWQELRPTTLYGILPTLEFDGKILSGNGTIARYLAEKFELAGKTPEENAEIYSMVDCIEDLWQHIAAMFREQDEAIKAERRKVFVEKYLPVPLMKLEKAAASNGTPQGWLYGSKVTYADLSVAVLLEMLAKNHPAILDSLPTLAKLKISVEQLPAIDKWIKSRPETPY